MSISIHLNPKPLKKISAGVQHHQERFSEKDGLDVLKNTSSNIDVSQTKFNKLLFKSNELNNDSVIKFVSNELEIVNEKRKNELGLRRFRPDANVIALGTLQISDDSLEKLGYDKSKSASEQSERAIRNVTVVYKRMIMNAISKPDMYGKVLTATLHFDESSPHVDFMSTGVDAERPDWSLREVLNGKEWRDENGKRRFPPKGKKLRDLQDDLDSVFSEKERKDYGLHRGERQSSKVDFARETRKVKKQLDDKSKVLNERESELDARERDLNVREANLLQGISESLLEARREVKERLEEKDRLERENARMRAEIERLDGISIEQQDKLVLEFMKNTPSKNVPGKMLYEVVNGNRIQADNKRLLDRVDNLMSGIQTGDAEGLMREMKLGAPSKQKQREYGD